MKGIGVSPGIAEGNALILNKEKIHVKDEYIDEYEVDSEIQRFIKAKEQSQEQIEAIYEDTLKKMGKSEAEIFEAHIELINDPSIAEKVEHNIKTKLLKAEPALVKAIDEISGIFGTIDDEYIKERAADVKDIGKRMLYNLLGLNASLDMDDGQEVIIIADDLTPSDTAQLDFSKVKGFAINKGGKTSHVAIMAKSIGIPAIVGAKDITARVSQGDTIIIDGAAGDILINPSPEEKEKYVDKKLKTDKELKELRSIKDMAAVTLDGRRVEISANIGFPADVKAALENGAEGIGLFRTELLFMDREDLPDEEEQFLKYKETAERMQGKPVIIRTLDIGGDKDLPYLGLVKEDNPFLGWRAIRFCLERLDVFKPQLRAILRASHYGKILIMFPMIATVDEVRRSKAVVEEVKMELTNEGIPFDKDIKIGIMIETPASAIIADKLIKEVDFFSIGTNDLTQYTLAVDRGNDKISKLYQPTHPAVLRLIKNVIDTSHKEGKWTGMCGEFAGDHKAAMLLLGLGLDEFSMSAGSIPRIKKLIRTMEYEAAKKIAAEVMEMESSEEVCSHLDSLHDNFRRSRDE